MTTEDDRLKQLQRCIPGIFWEFDHILYVGANPDRFHFRDVMYEKGCMVTVLEVVPKRAAGLKNRENGTDWLQVIHGDVREVDKFAERHTFNCVLWSHGPEILPENEIIPAIKKLEEVVIPAGVVILMCPWGKYSYEQDPNTINIADYNQSPLYPDFFHKLDYKTDCIGDVDINGSNLLAWKFMAE